MSDYSQSEIPDFIDEATRLLTDRYGSVWLEAETGSSVLFVGVVRAQAEDARTLEEAAPPNVRIRVVDVRYSEEDLQEFLERLRAGLIRRDSVVALSSVVASNKVKLTLREVDRAAVREARELIPKDALQVDIGPVVEGIGL